MAGLDHPPASSDYRPLIAFEVDSSFHDYAEGVNNQLSSPEDPELFPLGFNFANKIKWLPDPMIFSRKISLIMGPLE